MKWMIFSKTVSERTKEQDFNLMSSLSFSSRFSMVNRGRISVSFRRDFVKSS